MIVKRLLADLENSAADERARGAEALARAYLHDDLSEMEILDAETALTALLDDPVLAVRRAIARILGSSRNAPAHVIAALASDHSLVAGRVLTHSPLLSDDDLIEALGVADSYAQVAIALRPGLSSKVAAIIAAVGGRESMIALAVNESALLEEAEMLVILERHGTDGEVREALLGRSHLPAPIQTAIATLTAAALEQFATRTGWLGPQRSERCTREARELTIIEIAAQEFARTETLPVALAAQLRDNGQLTPSLLLKALLCGERSLFEATLAMLSGIAIRRVSGLARAWSGAGFAALYARAGLPAGLLSAFRAALSALDDTGITTEPGEPLQLSGVLIERTLTACERVPSPELREVTALLHRLRAEALRQEARAVSADMIEHARTAMLEAPADSHAAGARIAPQIDLEAIEAAILPRDEDIAA